MPDNLPINPDPQNFISRIEWTKQRRRLIATIFSLTTIVLISVYIILLQDGTFGLIPPFHKPIKTEDAKDYIRKHRNTLVFRDQTDVITYDSGVIRKYVTEIFPHLVDSINNTDPNYHWEVGFYPMHRFDDNGNRRLDFAVIPTLVAKDGSHILDFYSGKKNPEKGSEQEKKRTGSAKRSLDAFDCSGCYVYDAGNIWP